MHNLSSLTARYYSLPLHLNILFQGSLNLTISIKCFEQIYFYLLHMVTLLLPPPRSFCSPGKYPYFSGQLMVLYLKKHDV